MSGSGRTWLSLGSLAVAAASALPAGNEPAAGPTTARVDLRRPQSQRIAIGDLRKTMREVRRAARRPLASRPADPALRKAIERLRSRERSPIPTHRDWSLGPLRPAPVEPQPASASQAAAPPAAAQTTTPPAARTTGQESGPLTAGLLKKISQIKPQEAVNPAALADALFMAGRAKIAFGFYQAALGAQKDPDEQAWLLYQMGNCRRRYDPVGARRIYRRLGAEHAGSTWRPLAEVQDRLVEWHQVHKPADVLARAAALTPPRPRTPRRPPAAAPASGPTTRPNR